MDGIIEVAEQTNSPLIVILSIILVAVSTSLGTFLLTYWKINQRELKRINSLIVLKDRQIIDINKEKDDVVEERNRQMSDLAEKAFAVISNNNISSIRCRDAMNDVKEKISHLSV